MKSLSKIEKNLAIKGKKIVGVDEVGRGSLVGPVVACAFYINSFNNEIDVYDSKTLSIKRRSHIFAEIMNSYPVFGIGYSTHKEIDQINILNATKLAMTRALKNLSITPDILLIDGNQKIGTKYDEIAIIKGDQNCKSIAAASIVAKFSRDFLLNKISRIFPYYNLNKNKGYGTKEHWNMLTKFGPSPFHRKTFKFK